jgi:hypothetical protein
MTNKRDEKICQQKRFHCANWLILIVRLMQIAILKFLNIINHILSLSFYEEKLLNIIGRGEGGERKSNQ